MSAICEPQFTAYEASASYDEMEYVGGVADDGQLKLRYMITKTELTDLSCYSRSNF